MRRLSAATRTAPLWRDRRGVASIEAAMAASLILVPLCMGAADMGDAEAAASRVDRALQAAVYYVWNNSGSYTVSNIQSAAQTAYGTGAPTLTVTPTTSCSCVSSGYIQVSSVGCAVTCPSGQTLATYVTIAASTTYSVPARFPGFPSTEAINVTGTVRIQ